MNITTVGLDLAKNVFHVEGLDEHGHEKMKKRLLRSQCFLIAHPGSKATALLEFLPPANPAACE